MEGGRDLEEALLEYEHGAGDADEHEGLGGEEGEEDTAAGRRHQRLLHAQRPVRLVAQDGPEGDGEEEAGQEDEDEGGQALGAQSIAARPSSLAPGQGVGVGEAGT